MKGYTLVLLCAAATPVIADIILGPTSIVELQRERATESVVLPDSEGRGARLDLVNLAPTVNTSFLLSLQKPGISQPQAFHLENPAPHTQRLTLKNAKAGQVLLVSNGSATPCELWPGDALEQARQSRQPWAPLCQGRLYLRNPVRGRSTALEATSQYLRDYVWQGEKIVSFVRREFYEDIYIEHADSSGSPIGTTVAADMREPPDAHVLPAKAVQPLIARGLGVDVGTNGALLQGKWYGALKLDGVYVSLIQPGALVPFERRHGDRVLTLDSVESEALTYLVAFDLSKIELGFALGTEHPRLDWSVRTPKSQKDARFAGPDGIGSAAPLVRNGIVGPWLQPRVIATFTGGFKREHGAFLYGALANQNHGSHYGFIEQGVVYSSLVPGLSTLYVLRDGQIGMKTWSVEDSSLLPQIRHARQNGVPLLERSPSGQEPVFGGLLGIWGAGNWSGSEDEKLRTLRAGACVIEGATHRYLIYGYFSTATPSAMARVFQAYGCIYAMHLDMNALEHTYLALFQHNGRDVRIEHLVTGMAVLDTGPAAQMGPRFLGVPSNRDFFYVMTRQGVR